MATIKRESVGTFGNGLGIELGEQTVVGEDICLGGVIYRRGQITFERTPGTRVTSENNRVSIIQPDGSLTHYITLIF